VITKLFLIHSPNRSYKNKGGLGLKEKRWTVFIPEFISPIEPQREILEPIAELKLGLARDEEELISIASKVDAILVSMNTHMTRSVIEACPQLKIIAKYGVGLENIDIEAATDMHIPVTYNPGVMPMLSLHLRLD
jgi:D-3-phosphoglycerate dehydrogenase